MMVLATMRLYEAIHTVPVHVAATRTEMRYARPQVVVERRASQRDLVALSLLLIDRGEQSR
jgi:hypothetical protein